MSDNKDKPLILIVEDEAALLEAIAKKIEMKGYETVTATTGEQALDYLNNIERNPDAIWLDYYLGEMNGLEFMNKLKEKDKWQNIPVLVVSNSASEEKVSTMLGLGASKYVLKANYRLEDIINDTLTEIIKS